MSELGGGNDIFDTEIFRRYRNPRRLGPETSETPKTRFVLFWGVHDFFGGEASGSINWKTPKSGGKNLFSAEKERGERVGGRERHLRY